MSGELEITPGEQKTFQQSIKINNFPLFAESEEEFRSKHIEVFPGKKIAFIIKALPGYYTEYLLAGAGKAWTAISKNDKFLSLELVAQGRDVDPPRLAGKVEIILGDSSQFFNFGDPQNMKYHKFSATNRNLVIYPGKVLFVKGIGAANSNLAAPLFQVKLSGEETTLEIKLTLQYVSELNTKIMKDESTADLKITCGEKDNKKIFHVHKSFFCASSPVFRAVVENDMVEGRTKEIYIEEEEVDETTIREMINYIYTGKFTGKNLNVQSVAWLADKYDLPGMMDLLLFKMNEEVEDENIADMLIAAGKRPQHFLC